MKKKKFWKHGQQALFAEVAGLNPRSVNDVLHRRCGVSYYRALAFERASKLLFSNRKISWKHWIANRASKHPAFYGKPQPLKTYKRG